MCLLKQSDRDTGCGHSECKNFYMLNKPMCMYTYQSAQPSTSQTSSVSPIQSQIQLSSLLSQKQMTSIAPQSSLNVKRSAISSVEHVIGEQETLFLNKKKVKADDENKNDEMSRSELRNDSQSTFSDLSQLPQQIINQQQLSGGTPQQFQILNGQNVNGQIFFAKQEGLNYGYNQPTFYVPMIQTPQGNMNVNGGFTQLLATSQNGFNQNNIQQSFTPNNNKTKQQGNSTNNIIFGTNGSTASNNNVNTSFNSNANSSPSSFNNNSSNSSNCSKNQGNSTLEAFMKEFQTQTNSLLLSQSKMLSELKEKNDIIQDTLACLINEMSSLKNTIKQGTQEKPSQLNISSLMMNQIASNASETATTDVLLSYLYGPNFDFQYQLILKNNIQLPLYRERNFKFTLLLADKNGNLVENVNKIPLTIAIYSSESVPKFIDSNTAGNKILKGFIEKDLVNGSCTFDKIQIKEVTSHFRNGWIFFVVYPKVTNTVNNTVLVSGKDTFIPAQKIRPFILEKVVVKAKKAKEKEIELERELDQELELDQANDTIFQEDEEPESEEIPAQTKVASE